MLDRVVARWARAGDTGGATAAADVSGSARPPLLDWLNTYGVRFLMPFDGT